MWRKNRVSLAMTLLLMACTGCRTAPHTPLVGPVPSTPVPGPVLPGPSLTAPEMATLLAEAARLAPEAVPAEIERLEVAADEGRTGDRLKLAHLLSRTDSATSDPDRALAILKGLAPAFQDPETQEIARLLTRILTLERDLRLARRQTAELQQKIERLKGLERDLDDSNGTIEPLSTPPGEPPPRTRKPAQAPAATTRGGPSP